MSAIDTGRFGVVVPDRLDLGTIPEARRALRAALPAIEEGNDRLAWRLYVDAWGEEPEDTRALFVAAKVYGKRLKTPRRRRKAAKL